MREYYYETVYILRPTLSDEEIEKAIEKVNNAVEKYNGKVLHIDKWGKKQLAYPINDYQMGYYVLIHAYTNDRNFVKNLENFFRINEDVIRFLSFRIKPSEVKGLKKEEAKSDSEANNG
ncbi:MULTISPECIES: 30S ribosomal protein S6 [unclassified Desulfurobacterium]|uniref:30S ribosomal protein S6 n=1 Tax=unclassified Desulfurobacterium TaxID=2639089 RepID=UPI0003B56DE6|nr:MULTISPECIES: 30S ribosomal protein S6 [unclassified Desulfurobacterium]